MRLRSWRSRIAFLIAAFATLLMFQTGAQAKSPKPADTVLVNARVTTVNDSQKNAKVLAIRGKKIVYVGGNNRKKWGKFVGAKTKVVNLKGKRVLPGMTDAHTHPSAVALSSWHIALPQTNDLTKILEFVKDYAAEHPVSEVPFIYAEYYPSDMDWGPNGPNAAAIDAYVSDRPVLLQDFSEHASTVNSKMLELLGVDENTPIQIDPNDPAPKFVRGADGVTPTGHVLEFAWQYFADNMYDAIGWRPSEEVTPELLANFTRPLSEKGVTSVYDVIAKEDTLAAAAELDRRGELNMNYFGARRFTSLADLSENIATLRDMQKKYGSRHIRLTAMKFFLDGTNELGTSAVLKPFEIGDNDRGELRMSKPDLVKTMTRLNKENLDLHIHLVGDRAFRVACDAVAEARKKLGKSWRTRVTLTHNELIDPADMKRVARLGIILNWTPHWSGGYFGEGAAEWLGWERFNRMYQFNPVIKSGGIVNYGSDVVTQYEAHRANPFFGMQAAHTRIDPEFPMSPGPGTVPGTEVRKPLSARLSLRDLVEGYTKNGAIQLRIAKSTGTLAVGKMANVVVLNKDLFKVPAGKIKDVTPTAVLFEGKVVRGKLR